MQLNRLMSIDPSLTCSGWALFSIRDERLLAVGKIKSKPARFPLAIRLLDLQQKIKEIFERLQLSERDVLVCEAQTTMRDPRAAFKVEQVRGVFETIARERALEVPGRINPRSVQNQVMGLKGKQLRRSVVKDTALQTVMAVYGSSLENIGFQVSADNLKKHQDIVDAILVGSLGLVRIAAARRTVQPLTTFFTNE